LKRKLKFTTNVIVEKDGKLLLFAIYQADIEIPTIIQAVGYKSFCGLIIFIKLHQIYFR